MRFQTLNFPASTSFLLAASIILSLYSHAHAAQSMTKLFVAYGSVSSNAAPLWIAQEQGFFNKYGMDAEPVFIIGGRAIQAMVAGQVEVGFIGPVHVTNAVTAGGDLAMILGLRNKLNTIFVARPSIKSPEQLKGKKVATGTPGGPVSLAVYLVLDYFGLNSQRDKIVLLQVGGTAERLAALRAGSVEATSLPPELARVLISEGYHVLLDTGKEDIPFQFLGLVTSRKLIKSKPLFVDNIAKAIVESVAFIHKPSNKKPVEQTLARHLRLDRADLVEEAYLDILTGFPRKPCPTMRGVASVLKLMAQHGINPKASQLTSEDIVDPSICERLDESGFIDRLYKSY
jgi:NitT/TauT family transport system substrate-binding protein